MLLYNKNSGVINQTYNAWDKYLKDFIDLANTYIKNSFYNADKIMMYNHFKYIIM